MQRGRQRALGALLGLAAACAGDPAREADRPFQSGLAEVEQLAVLPQPEPATLRVLARGRLPDACTRLAGERRQRRGGRIRIELGTRRESGQSCPPEPRPFSRILLLHTADLPAGFYTLEVNGVRTVFEVPAGRWPTDDPRREPGLD